MSLYSEIKSFQKGPEGTSGYLMFYIYRKVSVYFSMLFIKLRFSPNFITLLSMLSDFLVVYLLYLQNWIIAGILVNLAVILDCCDGEAARYYKSKLKGREKRLAEQKHFGGYLDEILGTIGFTLIVLFGGYFMGKLWIGIFSMYGLFLVILSSLTAQLEFPNKKEIAKRFEQSLFGKLRGRIGFSCPMQRILVSLALIFSSQTILFLFGILCYLFVALKFIIYRHQ